MPDDLAAQLAEWGEDFEEELNRAVAEEDGSLKRSLSLLAAVEAVLELAGKPSTGIPPIRIREAITRALNGENPDA